MSVENPAPLPSLSLILGESVVTIGSGGDPAPLPHLGLLLEVLPPIRQGSLSTFETAEDTFAAEGFTQDFVNVSTYWKFRREIFADKTLDYWVIGASDDLLTRGSGTTSATGQLIVPIPNQYAGQKVVVVVNNLTQTMSTTNRVQGQQVVTVQ